LGAADEKRGGWIEKVRARQMRLQTLFTARANACVEQADGC
jgi:hypothetical protein